MPGWFWYSCSARHAGRGRWVGGGTSRRFRREDVPERLLKKIDCISLCALRESIRTEVSRVTSRFDRAPCALSFCFPCFLLVFLAVPGGVLRGGVLSCVLRRRRRQKPGLEFNGTGCVWQEISQLAFASIFLEPTRPGSFLLLAPSLCVCSRLLLLC